MELKKYSAKQILKWRPCEPYPKLLKAIAEKHPEARVDALDILKSDMLPEDKIWLAVRMVDDKTARLFACDCAERTLDNLPPEDVDLRSYKAIEMSRKYASSQASEEELRTAWKAARETWAATSEAVWEAACEAAWEWQVKHLIEMIEGRQNGHTVCL